MKLNLKWNFDDPLKTIKYVGSDSNMTIEQYMNQPITIFGMTEDSEFGLIKIENNEYFDNFQVEGITIYDLMKSLNKELNIIIDPDDKTDVWKFYDFMIKTGRYLKGSKRLILVQRFEKEELTIKDLLKTYYDIKCINNNKIINDNGLWTIQFPNPKF